MKIAICISGHIRDFYKYIDRFLENFVLELKKEHEVDIFLSTWSDLYLAPEDTDGFGPQQFVGDIRPDYKNVYDYIKILKPKLFLLEDYKDEKYKFKPETFLKWDEKTVDSWVEFQKSVHGYNRRHITWSASMWYKIYSANYLRVISQQISGKRYDCVFRCRPDLVFLNKFNLDETKFEPNIINTPTETSAHYPSIADCMFWSDERTMDKLTAMFTHMKGMMNQKGLGIFGNENMLYLLVMAQKININLVHGIDVDRQRNNTIYQ